MARSIRLGAQGAGASRPRSRAQRLLSILAFSPFILVQSLFLFAWITLLRMHLNRDWSRANSIFFLFIDTTLSTFFVGSAAGCFAIAVFKNPGTPKWDQETDVEGGRERSLPAREVERERDGEAEAGAQQNSRHPGIEVETEEEVEGDGEFEGPNAPLLSAPEGSVDARGMLAMRLMPGAPRLPSRTGLVQLEETLQRAGARGQKKTTARLGNLQVKSSTGQQRWCAKCNAPKPDRAHHCSTCGVCILRMDHHCPWLASRCVGLRNHKAFFLFLFYTCLLCLWTSQATARALLDYVSSEKDGFENSPLSWAILFFIAFVFGIALIPFAGYHAWLICRNKTTLESMEGSGRVRLQAQRAPGRESVTERLRRLAAEDEDHRPEEHSTGQTSSDQSGQERNNEELTREERKALKRAGKLNIYDLGASENWKFMMGRRWFMWFVPTGEPDSDGHAYAVNDITLAELRRITSSIRQRGASTPANASSSLFHISSIRGKARESPLHSSRNKVQSNPLSDSPGPAATRQPRGPARSAHGVVEWGAPPRKDFVLYDVNDSDDEGGGLGTPGEADEVSVSLSRDPFAPATDDHQTSVGGDNVWR
ncbi:zf-DHHC-domain-containing protein [Ceraceosorus guamensis]|uniref:Palmitoyltransferase n=1 Tax=Ceraceosorus guamensis TaxID=1522189 RepID=A0A316VY48_9BASI|nr:zf-DHHC-domain-containing protein [Ceraceosorus guamensis]PWN41221.1 zf-DHHC-domain-containing protein [Ceraceosorus guamensis]